MTNFHVASSNLSYKRDYSNFDVGALLAEVQFINWEEVLPTKADTSIFLIHFIPKQLK